MLYGSSHIRIFDTFLLSCPSVCCMYTEQKGCIETKLAHLNLDKVHSRRNPAHFREEEEEETSWKMMQFFSVWTH